MLLILKKALTDNLANLRTDSSVAPVFPEEA
jgi:hypothetical protein